MALHLAIAAPHDSSTRTDVGSPTLSDWTSTTRFDRFSGSGSKHASTIPEGHLQIRRTAVGLILGLVCLGAGATIGADRLEYSRLTVPVGPRVDRGDLRIRGGWLFDGVRDEIVPNPGILIRHGKIVGVGDVTLTENVGDDVQQLELGDADHVLPGFFDLHAHYAIDLFGAGRVDETEAYPVIFLANGVTTTFPAGEVNPEEMRALRIAIDRGERIGPRIFNSGPYFGSARRGWDPGMTSEEIRDQVDLWAARGVRGFKAKGIRPDHLDALIERAHQHGLTVTGHLGSGYRNTVNPRDAIRMGIDRVEHFLGGDAIRGDRPAYESLVEFDPESPEFDEIASLYRRSQVYFDATITAYGYFGERDPRVFTYFEDERAYLTPYMRRILEERGRRPANAQFERIYRVKLRTVKAFYDAGGDDLITLGTDHPSWGEYLSGFSVHRELHALVLSGIPPAHALKIATINGARALDAASYLGTIEPGKFADLVIVHGNPLADIRNTRNVRLVVKAGRVYRSRELLDSVKGSIGPAGPDQADAWMPERSSSG